jgi:TolA-binding protein
MLNPMMNGRNKWRRLAAVTWVWLLLGAVIPLSLHAADNADARNLFRAATEAMADKAFERAAGDYSLFLQKFPNSPRLSEAAINLAETYYELKQYDEVLRVVELYQAKAGNVADRMGYLKARSIWEKGQYAESALAWRALADGYPKSKFLAEALYWEALARYQLKDWTGLVAALTDGKRPFQKLAEAEPANLFVMRGRLLLAEAQLEKNDLNGAEQVLVMLAEQALLPELAWQRLQLLVRVQRQAGRGADAAQTAIGLLAQARSIGRADLIAESVALRGELLQALKQYDAALEMWQANLSESTPTERRRQALFAVIDLSTAKGETELARGQLTEFLKANPNDPAHGLVRLTLGELALKDFYKLKSAQPPVTDTNLLQTAKVQFDAVLTNVTVTGSNITGRAYLGRGWYGWEMGLMEAALNDFKQATEALPESNDQAIARFKWADIQFLRDDLEGASGNYGALIEQYRGVPAVRDGLLDQALYQLVRVGLRQGRLETASYALERLLDWFPERYYSENSLLLVGQSLGRAGQITDARRLLDDFIQRFPDSAKASEVKLAQARISVREQNWPEAINIYTNWLARYTNDAARPRAVFDLGWLRYKAGDEPMAFTTYTNFVTEFATNALVPQAHYWLAEYYEREKEFQPAATHYQLVFQNTNLPPGELSHRARLMAGRAYYSLTLYNQAEDYFKWLITNGPPQMVNSTISTQLVAQAYFALGDTHLADPTIDPVRPLDKFGDAINAFTFIEQFFKDSPLYPLACSKIASCHLQYAAQDPTRYDKAIEYYSITVESPLATVETRGLAEIGLAEVKEKLAELQPPGESRTNLWKVALEHYENVVYGKGLRENEDISPFVTEQAARRGANLLYTRLNQREQAVLLYRRLIEKVPALKDDIEKRISELQPVASVKTD